jgi:hypothetical protein
MGAQPLTLRRARQACPAHPRARPYTNQGDAMKRKILALGAVIGILTLVASCAAIEGGGGMRKAGGSTSTTGKCSGSPCPVAVKVGPGCHVTVDPFELHIPQGLGPTEIEFTLATTEGWSFDDIAITLVPPSNQYRQTSNSGTKVRLHDENTQRGRYPYHVHFKKTAGQKCSYDPIMINDPVGP